MPYDSNEQQHDTTLVTTSFTTLPEQEPTRSNDPTPVEGLWFEDGNIVLQAGLSMYKVYRGMLCSRSSVFKDMIDFPQPAGIPTFDGCPLIQIYDCSEDATCFFDALFNTTSSFFDVAPNFENVVSVLRLATKYDVPHLRARVLRYFHTWFPRTLRDFDHPAGKALAGQSSKNFMAVATARICNVPWILPVAMYRCATFPLPTIMLYTSDTDPEQMRRGFSMGEHRDTLIKGYHEFAEAMKANIWAPIRERCRYDDMDCNTARLLCLDTVLHNAQALSLDTSESWEYYAMRTDSRTQIICEQCYLIGKETIARERQALWDRIPQIFGLDSGEVLDAQRASDLDATEEP